MDRVVCFGEALLRLSPDLNQQWFRSEVTPVYLGGAELNVATALSLWDIPAKYCSVLPDNYLVHEIIQEIKYRKVESAIHLSGDRLGVYYLPAGADLKHAGVIYDRAHSSFSELKPGAINWDEVFEGASWFHFSAISPALNINLVAVCHEALEAAAKRNMTISVDLNYREKLWQYGENPCDVMPALVEKCDIVMGNIWAAKSLLGLGDGVRQSSGLTKDELQEAGKKGIEQLQSTYPNLKSVAYTFRLPANYFAILRHEDENTISKEFSLKNHVGNVGSGDCFMAGLIYGLRHQKASQDIIDFAAAAAVGKLTEKGDATKNKIKNIQQILLHE